MKIIKKIIGIFLIQAFILTNYAFCGEVGPFFCVNKELSSALAPEVIIKFPQFQDKFLREIILSGLRKNNGLVPATSKALQISARVIYRLVTKEEIAAIFEQAETRQKEMIILQLRINSGNVAKTVRDLKQYKIHSDKIYKLVSKDILESIRQKKKDREKEELIQVLEQYCLHAGWHKNTADALGISTASFKERLQKHGIAVSDLRKELELKALKQEKGNVTRAAGKLGLTRTRLEKYKREIKEFREQARQEEQARKIRLLFETLEETKGNRQLMFQSLRISEKTLSNWLKKYGDVYFPGLVEERLGRVDLLLEDLKQGGLEAKDAEIYQMRRFFSKSIERIEQHYGWMRVWQGPLQERFVSGELAHKIKKYEKLLKVLKKYLLDVPRVHRRFMKEDIDKIIKIIDYFYEQNVYIAVKESFEYSVPEIIRRGKLKMIQANVIHIIGQAI